jgi:hypothetical protein
VPDRRWRKRIARSDAQVRLYTPITIVGVRRITQAAEHAVASAVRTLG